jgi:riboflavin kinase/FMN adenylyltransferase
VTIGVFDGVHLGHQELVRRVLAQRPCEPTAVTFTQNPKAFLHPSGYPGDINTTGQKLEIFASLGIIHTILIDFSENFSKMSGKEFLDLLIERGNMRYLAVGSDFRCGRGRDTDAAKITGICREAGIPAFAIDPVEDDGGPVSSSRVRDAVRAGDFAQAASLLGRAFTLDLRGLPEPEAGVYSLAGSGRLLPPDGAYRAALLPYGEEGEVEIREGRVFVRSRSPVTGIRAFLKKSG